MNRISFLAAAAVLVTSAYAEPATPPPGAPLAPVAGGLSARLAPLGTWVDGDTRDFKASLQSQLEQARTQTHELIDRIVDEGGLPEFLDAMSREDAESSTLADELREAEPERARAVLHSRVERQLASFGKTIQSGLRQEKPERLKASFDLALKDLAREENHLMATLDDEAAGPAAPASSDLDLNHEELDEPPAEDAPAAPSGMGPAAPEGRHGARGRRGGRGRMSGRNGMGPPGHRAPPVARHAPPVNRHAPPNMRRSDSHHRGHGRAHRGHGRGHGRGHHGGHHRRMHRQMHQVQHQLRHTQRHLRQAQRQVYRNQMYRVGRHQRQHMRHHRRRMHRRLDRQRRQAQVYAQSQRAAWLNAQARAAAWNARALGYQSYGYRPGYTRRYSRPFPTGYYYRPDRVERVVRRGLWGAATVAATPFALLASIF